MHETFTSSVLQTWAQARSNPCARSLVPSLPCLPVVESTPQGNVTTSQSHYQGITHPAPQKNAQRLADTASHVLAPQLSHYTTPTSQGSSQDMSFHPGDITYYPVLMGLLLLATPRINGLDRGAQEQIITF